MGCANGKKPVKIEPGLKESALKPFQILNADNLGDVITDEVSEQISNNKSATMIHKAISFQVLSFLKRVSLIENGFLFQIAKLRGDPQQNQQASS